MANEKIRKAAQNAGVKLWEVAEKLNLQDYTFSRKLRHEFSDEETEKVLKTISELSHQKGENADAQVKAC